MPERICSDCCNNQETVVIKLVYSSYGGQSWLTITAEVQIAQERHIETKRMKEDKGTGRQNHKAKLERARNNKESHMLMPHLFITI